MIREGEREKRKKKKKSIGTAMKPRTEPRCRTKGQLQSPLLALPAEIRHQIYRYALVKESPIDLWPHKWATSDEVKTRTGTPKKSTTHLTLKVRRQEDLEYVRKEMSTGLLGTCKQVYSEAAWLFWSENRFRFSGRSGWQGLLRFFLTIGPDARSRIRRLDVHAPVYMRWPNKDVDNKDMNGRSKNFPKMHMVKVPEEGHLDRQAIQRVCALLVQDRALEEINFIIPKGFRNGDENYFGGYQEDHDNDTEIGRLRLDRVRALDFAKKTVIVESGGYLAVEDAAEQIMAEGWDLICQPGSFIWEKEGKQDKVFTTTADHEKHAVTETRAWSAPHRRWDYLEGVAELLRDREEISVHANAGRHAKKRGAVRKLERCLGAFSGGGVKAAAPGLGLGLGLGPAVVVIPPAAIVTDADEEGQRQQQQQQNVPVLLST